MIEKLLKVSLIVFVLCLFLYGVGYVITPRISILTYEGFDSVWEMQEYWDAADRMGVLFRAKVGFWLGYIFAIPMLVSLTSTIALYFAFIFKSRRAA